MNTTNEPLHQWKPVESLSELKPGDIVRDKNLLTEFLVLGSDSTVDRVVISQTVILSPSLVPELEVLRPVIQEPQKPKQPELFPCPVCDGNAKGYPDKMEFGCPQCGVFACSSVAWNAIPRRAPVRLL